jgi:hypothetical protein
MLVVEWVSLMVHNLAQGLVLEWEEVLDLELEHELGAWWVNLWEEVTGWDRWLAEMLASGLVAK